MHIRSILNNNKQASQPSQSIQKEEIPNKTRLTSKLNPQLLENASQSSGIKSRMRNTYKFKSMVVVAWSCVLRRVRLQWFVLTLQKVNNAMIIDIVYECTTKMVSLCADSILCAPSPIPCFWSCEARCSRFHSQASSFLLWA